MRHLLSRLYAAAARRRRRHFATHPSARRRLRSPVVSVGALNAGGSGKTPVTAEVARRLVAMGERPAVLSRGYRREEPVDGAVVVRDHEMVRGRLETAGDEPWMLAQQLDGVAVVVALDRHLAGTLAESRLGATVHVLDDGFQHLALERAVDLVVVRPGDLDDAVLPAGRLRESLTTVVEADATLIVDPDAGVRARVAERLGVSTSFGVTMTLQSPLVRSPGAAEEEVPAGTPVFAVAGIADPGRFVRDLSDGGWAPSGTAFFSDHHPYTGADLQRCVRQAEAAGAQVIVTTEKDWVRLLRWLPTTIPVAVARLKTDVESANDLDRLLADGLAAVRERVA